MKAKLNKLSLNVAIQTSSFARLKQGVKGDVVALWLACGTWF